MFCTACAAHNRRSDTQCQSCGAPLGNPRQPGAFSGRRMPPGAARALYLLPLTVLILAGFIGFNRYRADHAAAADAYARAEAMLSVGKVEQAIAAFAEAGDYRDADQRRSAAIEQLAPYRAAYLDGVAALDAGQPEDAIAALLPVARDLPEFENAALLLEEARRRREDDLLRQADLAEAQRDWLAADRALAALLALDPENETVADRLTTIRREHAPLILTQDGSLYLVGPDLVDERLITDEVEVSFPSWSPDRTRVAFLSPKPDDYTGRTQLYVIGIDGTGLTMLADDVVLDGWPSWSPDGAKIAFTSYTSSTPTGARREPTTIGVVDLATGDIETVTNEDYPYALSPSWSPGGERLAFIVKNPFRQGDGPGYRNRGDVFIYEFATGTLTNVTEERVPYADRVSWSPAGNQVLIYAVDRSTPWYERALTRIALLDLATGEIEEFGNQSQNVGLPYWSPDGRAFAFVEGDEVVRIRWIGEEEAAWVDVPRSVSSILTWSPDGSVLIAVAGDARHPSTVIPLDDGPVAERPGPVQDLALTFDLAAPWIGPPQWAPARLIEPDGVPSVGGVGLDATR